MSVSCGVGGGRCISDHRLRRMNSTTALGFDIRNAAVVVFFVPNFFIFQLLPDDNELISTFALNASTHIHCNLHN